MLDVVLLSGASYFSTGSAQATSCLTRELLYRGNRVLFLEDFLTRRTPPPIGDLKLINTYQFNKKKDCCLKGEHIIKRHPDTEFFKSWKHSFDSDFTRDDLEFEKFHELLNRWEKEGNKKICVVSCSKPNFVEMGKLCKDRGYKVIYYYLDDWKEFKEVGQGKWYNEERELELFKLSDRVICTARSLYRNAKKYNGNTFMFPNAYDHRVFQTVSTPKIKDGRKHGSYNICMAGWLDGNWIDWDCIEGLIKNLPAVGINIIGALPTPTKDNLEFMYRVIGYNKREKRWNKPRETNWEKKYNNLSFIGEVPYSEIPGYFNQMDIGLIPFLPGKLTKAVSPVKIFNYLAGGMKVVAIEDLTDIEGYPNTFFYKEDCLSKVVRAMNTEWKDCTEFLSQHTWEKRMDLFLDIIGDKRCEKK